MGEYRACTSFLIEVVTHATLRYELFTCEQSSYTAVFNTDQENKAYTARVIENQNRNDKLWVLSHTWF
jgi:hypothetical protein